MDREMAVRILGETVQLDGSLYNLGHYTAWDVGDQDIVLDDRFSAEELEALAWWMKNTPKAP
jgi:hypothetical protein